MQNTTPLQSFLNDYVTRATAAGIAVRFVPTEQILLSNGLRVSGYFDRVRREMCVALYCRHFPFVVAHEFHHLQQMVEGRYVMGETGVGEIIQRHQDGEDIPEEKLQAAIDFLVTCEFEAEMAAVSDTQIACLAGDQTESYIAGANSYLLGHKYMQKYRKWPSLPHDINSLGIFATGAVIHPNEYPKDTLDKILDTMRLVSLLEEGESPSPKPKRAKNDKKKTRRKPQRSNGTRSRSRDSKA